jgi:TolB-like protein/DNA-binding winged helix-turn-helix (wHTH) protein/Flp pilus assembly protein TadD
MAVPNQAAPSDRYRFGDFLLDTGARSLLRFGEPIPQPIPLTLKEFDTLVALVQCAGQAVEKDSLVRTVWPDSFVGDGSLARNISILRKHIGPDAIQTIPKHGYRFACPVSIAPAADQRAEMQLVQPFPLKQPSPEPKPAAEPRLANTSSIRKSTQRVWLGGLVLVACLLLLGMWRTSRRTAQGTDIKPSGPVRIAILPFHDVSSSRDTEYLSNGIVEELITELGQSTGDRLRVLAKGSASEYRETNKKPSLIAHELGVQYLVLGTVRLIDRQVEVNVQLVNGSDQSVAWAGKYTRPRGQFSQIQAEITDSVAREVQANLPPSVAASAQIGGTSNPLAHDAYLHGRLDLERKNRESGRRALQEFHDATVLDPKYALAYAGLSELYINFANNTPTGPAYAYAKEAALKAIRLDERVAEAHRDLAWILDNNESDWMGAAREYRRALELNPSDSRAHHWYAQYLVEQGKAQQALREAQAGLELDPLSEGSNYNYGFILIENGQFDQAIEHLQHELLREPNSEVVYGYLGIAYDRKHDYDKSAIAFQRAADVSTLHKQYEADAARSLALGGNTSEARRIVTRLHRELNRGVWMPAINLALAYFALGDKDEGFSLLRKALQEHSCTLLEINTEPMLVALRTDPRLVTLRTQFHLGGAVPISSVASSTASSDQTQAQVRP